MSKSTYLLAEEPSSDLIIAEAIVAELEDYIINDALYRPLVVRVTDGDRRLQMSGGDFLARLHRLDGARNLLSAEEQQRLDVVRNASERTIYELKTRFLQRLQREMKARQDSLRWFLDECDADRMKCRTDYPFEIRNRQRIEEILKLTGDGTPQALRVAPKKIDRRIRQHAQGSEFLWDKRLEMVYPAKRYWYLHMRPR